MAEPTPQAKPAEAKPTEAPADKTAAEATDKGKKYQARVQGPWTSWQVNDDLLLTNEFVEVTFDQAADIQEAATAAGVPYIIEDKD